MKGPHVTFFPQYCREPLNDAAWYPGFTDWDLIDALPPPMQARFRPAAGCYDLAAQGDIAAQLAAIANSRWPAMGLYQYFFDGRFALEEVEKFILSSQTGVPAFFTIWANETWSKRWVGKPNEIIIRQNHSLDERTVTMHVQRLCRLFSHPSYRHWNGRPVFVMYFVYGVPGLARLLATYREAFRRRGVDPQLGFCAPYVDPGFDASGFDFCVEFQPRLFFNVMRGRNTPHMERTALALKRWMPRLYETLAGIREMRTRRRMVPREVYSYRDYLQLVEQGVFVRLLEQAYGLPVIRGLFYSWNNFPRYRGGAIVVNHGADDYDEFLRLNDQWSVTQPWFLVNSWNEWSEGAALEPGAQPAQSYERAAGS